MRGNSPAHGNSFANGPLKPWRHNWEYAALIKESQTDIWKFME